MHILSIQSSVAYGYAGNSAATFPLRRLGHEVWPVNTVQFSNHTGYGSFRGMVFDPADVADVICGIEDRGVLGRADMVLTGYQGSPGVADVVLDAVARVRAANPDAVYCCDPVLGDAGKGMFVEPGLPELIRSRVLPAADILTPNAFELAYLAGTGGDPATAVPADVRDEAGILAAVDRLRALGPSTVLVTSVEDGAMIQPVPGGCDGPGETGELFGITDGSADAGTARLGGAGTADSSAGGATDNTGYAHDDALAAAGPATVSMIAVDASGAYRVSVPRLPLLANGAGDVTAAVFAAHLLTDGIELALARTASSLHGILTETLRQARILGGAGVEIALVDAQQAIAHPTCEFEVRRIR